MQTIHIRGGVVAQHVFGAFTAQRQHQQVANARQQVLHEPAWIEPADHHLLHHAVQCLAVLGDHRVDGLADQLLRREPQQRHGRIIGDRTVHGADHQLVEHRQRVTHGTAARTHGELEHARLGPDALLLADAFQVRPHDLLRHQPERIMMGARPDGADDLLRFGGGEDEHHMLGRLLHDLQQGVEALRRDHMRLVEDEDLVPVARGGESGAFAQLAGIVHAVMAGRVDLHHVDRPRSAGGQVLAAFAFAARMRRGALRAVHATRQDAGGAGLAAAARPGEQVGVGELALVEGAHQRHRDLVLADHAVEGVRTIPPIQCECHGRLPFTSPCRRCRFL